MPPEPPTPLNVSRTLTPPVSKTMDPLPDKYCLIPVNNNANINMYINHDQYYIYVLIST